MSVKHVIGSNAMDIYAAAPEGVMELPLAGEVSAGFPSPAEEYLDLSLDLNKALIKNPGATFYGRVRGNSMVDAGIREGDILVIDKSLEPADGKKAVCFVDGEFTLKTLKIDNSGVWLMPANKAYKPIQVTEDNAFLVWGIVTYVIHKM